MSPHDSYVLIRGTNGADPSEDRLSLHVREWPGTGVPFVLVHGLSSNAATWNSVAQCLAGEGHRVIAVDQRGHGQSDKPESGYDFETITGDLALLFEQMAIQYPIVVGQSWGGNVVLALGVRQGKGVRGLGLIDGGTIDLQLRPEATWESMRKRLTPPNLIGTPIEVIRERMRTFHPDWSDEGIEGTLANFEVLADGTIRPWLSLDRHMQILRAMWEQRPGHLYPQVKAPVLICPANNGGDPERLAHKQEEVAAASAGLPKATVHWFKQTDHDIHVHRPLELAQLLLLHTREGIWTS